MELIQFEPKRYNFHEVILDQTDKLIIQLTIRRSLLRERYEVAGSNWVDSDQFDSDEDTHEEIDAIGTLNKD